jgi:hypothetical protein
VADPDVGLPVGPAVEVEVWDREGLLEVGEAEPVDGVALPQAVSSEPNKVFDLRLWSPFSQQIVQTTMFR